MCKCHKLDKGYVVGAVFIDLQKAFDTVNLNLLSNKLTTFNFSEHAIGWFASYLEHREQRVRINTQRHYNSYMFSVLHLPATGAKSV